MQILSLYNILKQIAANCRPLDVNMTCTVLCQQGVWTVFTVVTKEPQSFSHTHTVNKAGQDVFKPDVLTCT